MTPGQEFIDHMERAKMNTTIIHLVGNAHLDPVWLWNRTDGTGEALSTCRTACDLLDEYPELRVTRGEAWVHWQVQRLDPALFERIRKHVRAGRWCVVNGWWVQPDCNLPLAESFLKQSEIGGDYFRENLGIQVTVGYNPDSFGHCAMLPTFLRRGGKDAYLFMRPDDREKQLPGTVFRWRSPAGDEVLACRVRSYAAGNVRGLRSLIGRELARAAPATGHVLVMYGIGDHGGGPTRAQIEWILANKQYAPGVELRFSDPATFFRCVRESGVELPLHEGELQMHAVGCYTVVRRQKRELRRAEHLLLAAERAAPPSRETAAQFTGAWRTVLFNQFHDLLGGSSIEKAMAESVDEAAAAKTVARELLTTAAYRRNTALPPCERQRLVVDNFGAGRFRGLVEYEPWLETGTGFPRGFLPVGEQGEMLPVQFMPPDAASAQICRALIPVDIPAGGRTVIELLRTESPKSDDGGLVNGDTLADGMLRARVGERGVASLARDGGEFLGAGGVRVEIIDDPSDTWSHGVEAFGATPQAVFTTDKPWQTIGSGPLRGELVNTLRAAASTLRMSVILDAGSGELRLKLRLNWCEQKKIAKLVIPAGFMVRSRRDGVPGALIPRALDGKETPIVDIVSVHGDGAALAAVSADVYAADVQPDGTLRLSLVRSPVFADEGNVPADVARISNHTDQGEHEHEIVLAPGLADDPLQEIAYRLNNPPLLTETTYGMPAGLTYGNRPRLRPDGLPQPSLRALPAERLLPLCRTAGARLVRSEERVARWRGARLLVAAAETLEVRLPVPAADMHQIRVIALCGDSFGALAVTADGRTLGALNGNGPVLAQFDTPCAGSETTLRFTRAGGSETAVGSVEIAVAALEIPASAWTVAGPYECAPPEDMAAALAVPFPPEENAAGVAWRSAAAQGDSEFLDMLTLTGRLLPSIGYARTWLNSPCRQEAVLAYGIDWWARIWLNGALVVAFESGAGNPVKRVPVTLETGWNELLVKVSAGSQGNGLACSVLCRDLPTVGDRRQETE